jgi:undecaprenyl-diphosphatase
MSVLEAIVLGFVQGMTEFLPVSSTGHLILVREFFGIAPEYGLAVDAVLQLATALAVLVYFRHSFLELGSAFIAYLTQWVRPAITPVPFPPLLSFLILGTVPALVAGLLLEEYMEMVFRSAELVAWMLLLGSGLLLLGEWMLKRYGAPRPLSLRKSFLMGCFQALALIPGVSRSGATISGGLMLGLSREEAARFAFLLSLPIILGSGLKKLLELSLDGFVATWGVELLLAALTSFVVGGLSIHLLLKYLRNHSLLVFVFYRILLAVVIFSIL